MPQPTPAYNKQYPMVALINPGNTLFTKIFSKIVVCFLLLCFAGFLGEVIEPPITRSTLKSRHALDSELWKPAKFTPGLLWK